MEATDPSESKPARGGRLRRILRSGATTSNEEPASAQDAFIAELQLELELLREENARLKIERERPGSSGGVIDQARTLQARVNATAFEDAAHDLMTEGMVLREGLLDACREMARAMAEIERRLVALGTEDRHVVDVALARLGDAGQARPRRIVPTHGEEDEQAAVGA